MRPVLVLLGVMLATGPSAACPPNKPCRKGKARPPAEVHQDPDRYVRLMKGAPPAFERKRLARYLIAGTWKPIYDKPLPLQRRTTPNATVITRDDDTLRFADPSRALPEAKDGQRIVLIRYIEKKKRTNIVLVDVDGVIYRLAACKSRPDLGCLTPSQVGFDEEDPEHPTAHVFPGATD